MVANRAGADEEGGNHRAAAAGGILNPYGVLNLPHTPASLTPEQVKANYKILARQLHPDKCGSHLSKDEATATFQALTEAYRAVMKDVRENEASSISKMKEQLSEFMQSQSQPRGNAGTSTSTSTSTNKFSLASFNTRFESSRITDPAVDEGYADWMRECDPETPEAAAAAAAKRALVATRDSHPQAVSLVSKRTAVGFSELGVERVSDYGRAPSERSALGFTDYVLAHTTSKLIEGDPETLLRAKTQFKDLRSIQKHRASADVSHEMTPEELESYAAEKDEAAAREERRLLALRRRDELVLRRFGGSLLNSS
jgi:curved DNA-binding protein CbpA